MPTNNSQSQNQSSKKAAGARDQQPARSGSGRSSRDTKQGKSEGGSTRKH